MNNDYDYVADMWRGVIMQCMAQGAKAEDAIVTADTVLAAYNKSFNDKQSN